jgi:hypothetical protein
MAEEGERGIRNVVVSFKKRLYPKILQNPIATDENTDKAEGQRPFLDLLFSDVVDHDEIEEDISEDLPEEVKASGQTEGGDERKKREDKKAEERKEEHGPDKGEMTRERHLKEREGQEETYDDLGENNLGKGIRRELEGEKERN